MTERAPAVVTRTSLRRTVALLLAWLAAGHAAAPAPAKGRD